MTRYAVSCGSARRPRSASNSRSCRERRYLRPIRSRLRESAPSCQQQQRPGRPVRMRTTDQRLRIGAQRAQQASPRPAHIAELRKQHREALLTERGKTPAYRCAAVGLGRAPTACRRRRRLAGSPGRFGRSTLCSVRASPSSSSWWFSPSSRRGVRQRDMPPRGGISPDRMRSWHTLALSRQGAAAA
jgi:hypothetical protein